MNIYPAIDLYEGAAVRLFQGNYNQMTVYADNPVHTAADFKEQGSSFLHLVDLEGAKKGISSNFNTIKDIVEKANLFTQLGGGIRDMATVEKYLSIGVNRIILGTSAITDKSFLMDAVEKYGDRIAVGIDIKDEKVAIKGWTELSSHSCDDFCKEMQNIGIKTIICTDISKDGAMEGTNLNLYRKLSKTYSVDIIASGGISSLEDIKALTAMKLSGAIVGKALYTGTFSLASAIETAKE
ncbi:1-(5-phosphoribosyl)-5-[(5-phosphoribosylamino)methylideneamino]imidazole-4-carboxamide isomerase [Aminipila sp.]|jgi:phosphoribosylformimino-5-aminoimidazole carboxamide ribotide isomerase|uniref:1-(5-phosphoribosyl)-5-[(5- phosphoribosylamino)methylideneamino]imidazole-4- carboxamide isomerase n=1 Tax=Aminipila sp. TaxID=2060095 RepID=UPI001E00369F|nr:1-(5-phosphoribosyl)-5-[(5-phosphoribosylamino)methylideneamino]imidazole-4-carboxamide isomerase [Aminipila sp.]MBE6034603.1 1-(5-phosphoribosyl)-5-[(5-phosphoribosylamino)methylideneamino]imidazole-4-carboxamide isomerase [Clostridiales bacterium]